MLFDWSGSSNALEFHETMSITFILSFENEKDSNRICSTLPEKSTPPELEDKQGNPFWNREARNREKKRKVGCC